MEHFRPDTRRGSRALPDGAFLDRKCFNHSIAALMSGGELSGHHGNIASKMHASVPGMALQVLPRIRQGSSRLHLRYLQGLQERLLQVRWPLTRPSCSRCVRRASSRRMDTRGCSSKDRASRNGSAAHHVGATPLAKVGGSSPPIPAVSRLWLTRPPP